MASSPRIAVLVHDPANPPLLVAEWLADAGADTHILRLHDGDPVPTDPHEFDGVISMGGALSVTDDERAPWLAATRALLAASVTAAVPTLGIGLGAQLLAYAMGGRVERGTDGPEIGAYLAAKRDVTDQDLIFGDAPISPDVMHIHRDVITTLPAGGVLMLSSPGYPTQAFRVGDTGWGIAFHIELTAEHLRRWRLDDLGSPFEWNFTDDELARSERRCGPLLDEAEELIGGIWNGFIAEFVDAARNGVPQTPTGWAGPRLPMADNGDSGQHHRKG